MIKKSKILIIVFVLAVILTFMTACKDSPDETPVTVSDIIIDTKNVNLEITAGDELDLKALIVKTINSDDSWTELNEGTFGYSIDYSDFNNEINGIYTIYVNYILFTKSFTVTVLPRVSGIIIDENSLHKTDFIWGENFSYDGLTVKKAMSDGNFKGLTAEDFTVDFSLYKSTNPQNTQANYKIKVILKENPKLTTEYTVTVGKRPAPVIVGMSAVQPIKTNYTIGEDIDLAGGKVTLIYDWGENTEINLPSPLISFSNFNSQAESRDQEVTLTHKESGFNATFKVNITKQICGIEIVSLPTKLNYTTKDALSYSGGVVRVNYNDDSYENVMMSNTTTFLVTNYSCTYSTFNKDEAGNEGLKTATVTLRGTNFSLNFDYYVIPKVKQIIWKAQPSSVYYIGDPDAVSGGIIEVTYDDFDSTSYEINLNEDQTAAEKKLIIEGFSALQENSSGVATVTLKNTSHSLTFNYSVYNDRAVAVNLLSVPSKTEYSGPNTIPDLSGGCLEVVLLSGETFVFDLSIPEPDITASAIDITQAGEQTISLKYKNYTDLIVTYEINFTISYTGFEITRTPTVLAYKHNSESYSFAGGQLSASYDNGTYGDWIDMNGESFKNNYTVQGWDSTQLKTDGILTITQNIDGFTQTLSYSIVDYVKIFNIIAPDKTEYYKGNALDLCGARAELIYSSAGKIDYALNYTDFSISNFHTNFLGPHPVYVTHIESGAQQSFSMTVLNRAKSISLTTPISKTEYFKGESVNPAGGELTVKYDFALESGSDTEIITTSDSRVTFPDFTTEIITDAYGKAATIEFFGATTFFNYKVIKQVTGIEWKTKPSISYIKGDSLKLAFASINIIYDATDYIAVALDTDQNKPMGSRIFSISGFDSSAIGTFSYCVTHIASGYSVTLSYTVAEPTVTELELCALPETNLLYGDSFNYDGVIIRRYFNNGTEDLVTLPCDEKILSEGFDSSILTLGTPKTITFTSVGTDVNLAVSYTISDWVSEFVVDTYPTRTVYYKDETAIDLTGGTYHLVWACAGATSSFDMTAGNLSAEGLDTTTQIFPEDCANITLTFVNDTKAPLTASYNYTVLDRISSVELTSIPYKTVYYIGQSTSLLGGVVKINYDFNAPDTINLPNSAFMTILDTSTSTLGGTRPLTIKHIVSGKSCSFEVSVKTRTLQNITIESAPAKLQYVKGEAISLAGGTIRVNYDLGEQDYISMISSDISIVSGDTLTVSPSVPITVSYLDKTANFNIEVVRSLTSVSINELPKTVYKKDDVLSLEGGLLNLHYDNATTEILDLNDQSVSVTGFDSSLFGEQILSVSYSGKTCNYTVNVKPFITALTFISNGTQTFDWNAPFNTNGLKVSATFDHDPEGLGNPREIFEGVEFYSYTVDSSTFVQNTAGTYTISIYWYPNNNIFASYDVTVKDSTIIETVALNIEPATVLTGYQSESYALWQNRNLSLTFNVTYTDQRIVEYAIASASSDYEIKNSSVSPSVAVTFNFEGSTFSANFEILEIVATALSLNTAPTENTFHEPHQPAEKDMLRGGIINVTYNNGTTATVNLLTADELSAGVSTDFASLIPSDTNPQMELIVYYGGQSLSLTVFYYQTV